MNWTRCPIHLKQTQVKLFQDEAATKQPEKGFLFLVVKRGEQIMTTANEAIQLISSLSLAEKARLLQWVVQDIGNSFPGVHVQADVAGGSACVVRTRIPVWLLAQARKSGHTDAEILTAYPNLRAEDLANAWAYYHAHRAEIEAEILENEMA